MTKRFNKKQKIVVGSSVIALLIVGIVLAVVLPLTLGKSNVPNTEYDLVKTTKKNNYTLLNQTAEHGQIVLIGDSITEIYGVGDHFTKFTRDTGKWIYNRGISGDTSDRMLERLKDNALNLSPAVLVILIGTNDIARNIAPDVIAANIEEGIKQTQQLSPRTKIVLQAVYPVHYNMSAASRSMVGGRSNDTIRQLNELLEAIAQAQGVTFLDLTRQLSDANGNLNANYCYDGLHLNAAGFEVVTQNLIPLFDTLS